MKNAMISFIAEVAMLITVRISAECLLKLEKTKDKVIGLCALYIAVIGAYLTGLF